MEHYRILTINPGSTSTKIGVFDNEQEVLVKTIRHDRSALSSFSNIIDQYQFRKEMILETLDQAGINLSKLSAVAGRGGLLRPIEGGTYTVNAQMLEDLKNGYAGQHASNLGGILAYEIASQLNLHSYIVDPVVVDEMDEISRFSGFAGMERKSIFHALNQKAAAREAAEKLSRPYEELRLIVAHMGGGITVGTHRYGKVVDVNNGLHGEGPFSPERAGTVPAGDLAALCYSGEHTYEEIMKRIVGEGGMVWYLDTNDAQEAAERAVQGDKRAELVLDAMAYQTAKEIGANAAVLEGKVDAIILTGGLAHGKEFVQKISSRVKWISRVLIQPGENELESLNAGVLRVLRGHEQAEEYKI